jgi:hypothetical protein
MRRKAENGFTKWPSGMLKTHLQSLAEVHTSTRSLFGMKFSLNDIFVFLRNKVIPGTFLSYHIHVYWH